MFEFWYNVELVAKSRTVWQINGSMDKESRHKTESKHGSRPKSAEMQWRIQSEKEGRLSTCNRGTRYYYWRHHDLPSLTFSCGTWLKLQLKLKLRWWGVSISPGQKRTGKMKERDKGGLKVLLAPEASGY